MAEPGNTHEALEEIAEQLRELSERMAEGPVSNAEVAAGVLRAQSMLTKAFASQQIWERLFESTETLTDEDIGLSTREVLKLQRVRGLAAKPELMTLFVALSTWWFDADGESMAAMPGWVNAALEELGEHFAIAPSDSWPTKQSWLLEHVAVYNKIGQHQRHMAKSRRLEKLDALQHEIFELERLLEGAFETGLVAAASEASGKKYARPRFYNEAEKSIERISKLLL